MSNSFYWSDDGSVTELPGKSQPVQESQKYSKTYHCHIAIINDDDGTVSIVVMNLPGAGSCGSSHEEAINNTREAVTGLIEFYLDKNGIIPWASPYSYDIPEEANQKWILVDV